MTYGASLFPYSDSSTKSGSHGNAVVIHAWADVRNPLMLLPAMDSDWQEVLIPPQDFLALLGATGQFTPDHLNRSGLCPGCPDTKRLTSLLYKLRSIQPPPPTINQYAHIISTIAFDTHQELLWVGDAYVSPSDHRSWLNSS